MQKKITAFFFALTLLTGLSLGVTISAKAEIIAEENLSLITGEVVSAEENDPMFNAGLWTVTFKLLSSEPVPFNANNLSEGNYANLMEKYVGKTIRAKGRIFKIRMAEQDLRNLAGKQIRAYVVLRSFDDFSIEKITVLKPQENQK